MPPSTISVTLLDASFVGCAIHSVVAGIQETLPDYIRRVISEKNLNYREVARRSGGAITHSAVHDIINGRSKDYKVSTLKGLAKGLEVSEEEIFAVARGKSVDAPRVRAQKLIEFFEGLPTDKQNDVLEYAEMRFNKYGSHLKKRA